MITIQKGEEKFGRPRGFHSQSGENKATSIIIATDYWAFCEMPEMQIICKSEFLS